MGQDPDTPNFHEGLLDLGRGPGGAHRRAAGRPPRPRPTSPGGHTLCLHDFQGRSSPNRTEPPAHCAICEDERQYVGPDGQKWTTLDALRSTHKNVYQARRAGALLDQYRAVVRDRPACVHATNMGGEHPLGLRCTPRRGNSRPDQRPGRNCGDRRVASSLLHHDGRVEPCLWQCADFSERGRTAVGDATGSLHPILDWPSAKELLETG